MATETIRNATGIELGSAQAGAADGRAPAAQERREARGSATKAERRVLAGTLIAALLGMAGLLVGLHLALQDYVIRMEPSFY